MGRLHSDRERIVDDSLSAVGGVTGSLNPESADDVEFAEFSSMTVSLGTGAD